MHPHPQYTPPCITKCFYSITFRYVRQTNRFFSFPNSHPFYWFVANVSLATGSIAFQKCWYPVTQECEMCTFNNKHSQRFSVAQRNLGMHPQAQTQYYKRHTDTHSCIHRRKWSQDDMTKYAYSVDKQKDRHCICLSNLMMAQFFCAVLKVSFKWSSVKHFKQKPHWFATNTCCRHF